MMVPGQTASQSGGDRLGELGERGGGVAIGIGDETIPSAVNNKDGYFEYSASV